MFVDLGRLESLLTEARRCAEAQIDYRERAEFAAAKEREVLAAVADATWISEMVADYRAQAQAAGEQLAALEQEIRGETLRQERFAGGSIRAQLALARFLDENGRDGAVLARRAALLLPLNVEEALQLSAYLQGKGCYAEAVTAARQGWQRFGDRVLRSQWADLLAQAGPVDDLIALLREDLRATPDDLALIERLARLLTEAGRLPEACEIMLRGLAHPAGATRLLAAFMQWLAAAGSADLAVGLARTYLRRPAIDKMAVRRELAETLRRNHYLPAAVAFLDDQIASTASLQGPHAEGPAGQGRSSSPAERDITAYRTSFLVNSLRSEDRSVRQEALALLHNRRDRAVEARLAALFDEARGDELRLLIIHSLAAIQGVDALPFLVAALAVDARRVRLAAARAVGETAAPAKNRGAVAGSTNGHPEAGMAWPETAPAAGATPRRNGRVHHAAPADGAVTLVPEGTSEGTRDDAPETPPIAESAAPADLPRSALWASSGGSPSSGGSAAEGAAEPARHAARALLARMAVEEDDDVRQALVDALHQVDPRPRRVWERPLGLRAWAEPQPQAWPRPRPGDRLRRGRNIALGLSVLAVALLMVAPLQPSPRAEVVRAWGVANGMLATRQAARHATATPVVTPNATATRASSAADMASGQASDALAADTARVQLSGQIATVRYIGVDAPAPGQPGAQAALDANRHLVVGRMVYLEQGAIPRDSSGRWLRYVWLPEGQMANERLLELGFAVPSADPQDTKYQQRLADAATKAWRNKAGFWSGGSDVFPMAAVKSDEANIREAPGTEQPVQLQLKQGTVLTVLGRNDTGDWVAVRVPGFTTGWIAVQVVDLTVRPASLPVVK